ncbi:MATE family efflux transporter [Sulfurospirillum sp.]|uniref:MATE family efflux transporter n=1 Tax=Sulfurospirillum sp. TaxID=2053622 RepID=UPI002FDE9705
MVTGIISVPLMLEYFGANLFGIWVLILGLAGYLNSVSFGIPSAMSTLVAKTVGSDQKYQILQKSIILLSGIVTLLIIIFLLSISTNDAWIIALLGNISEEYEEITKKVFILFVIITLIKIPLNTYIQFFVGMNLVYVSEVYQILNMILCFLVLFLSYYMKLDFFVFSILTLFCQGFLGVAAAIHVILKFRYLNANIHGSNVVSTKEILQSGFAFFQVGLAASLVWSTDNLVINHFLSPEFVTPYTIAFKIFTYIFIFSAIINGVMSPIYGNAYAENNFEKIRIYASSILKFLSVIGGFVWVSLLFFAKDVIELWTGDEHAFGGYLLIFSLGFYGFILSFVNTYATITLSLNYANKTLWIAWSEAILNLVLSIILIKYFGIGGVALSTALASFFTGFLFLPQAIKKLTNGRVYFESSFFIRHFIFLIIPSLLLAIFTISIDVFFIKFILYFVLFGLYLYVTWRFLHEKDKDIIFGILKRRA